MLKILPVIAAFLMAVNSFSAVKFQLRGTSKDAYYASAWKTHYVVRGADSTFPITSSGTAGVFGGSYLDMTSGPKVQYVGLDNGPTSGTAISILMRVVPNFTGTPAATIGLFELTQAGPGGGTASGGMSIGINTAGKMVLYAEKQHSSSAYSSGTFGTAINFVSGTPIDLWFVWDGTTTAGHMERWEASHGNTATKVDTLTASNAADTYDRFATQNILLHSPLNAAQNNKLHIVEVVIFDTAEVPSSYGARSDYVTTTASAFEGYTYTDPGIANVLAPGSGGPSSYTYNGLSKVGTYAPALPAAGDLRSGTVVSSVTGTLAVPAVSSVLSGVAVDATVGNYITVATAAAKIGTTFGASGALTGTYDGSDRWTSPLASELLSGVMLKSNSTSNNLTGTLLSTDPGIANVLSGVGYAINSTGYVGTYVASSTDPGIANVKLGTNYIIAATPLVGTYTGADRWSDPGISNVSAGTTYLANAVSKTGIRNVVTNVINRLQVYSRYGATVSSAQGSIVVTSGDTVTLAFNAVTAGVAFDLSGAVFETKIKDDSTGGYLVIADDQHTVDPDQITNKGNFTMVLPTISCRIRANQDVVTKVTLVDSTVMYFHGDGILTVLPALPEN